MLKSLILSLRVPSFQKLLLTLPEAWEMLRLPLWSNVLNSSRYFAFLVRFFPALFWYFLMLFDSSTQTTFHRLAPRRIKWLSARYIRVLNHARICKSQIAVIARQSTGLGLDLWSCRLLLDQLVEIHILVHAQISVDQDVTITCGWHLLSTRLCCRTCRVVSQIELYSKVFSFDLQQC